MADDPVPTSAERESTLSRTKPVNSRQPVVKIPLREIDINLSNPRKTIDEQELQELAESIRQHGLLQPILVRPLTDEERQRRKRKYQIVIGSRRFHAAERAGLKTIDCYVRGLAPEEAVVASFLDHAHHRTLTSSEEAEFLHFLREERKLRLREIAALISKSIAYVHKRLGVFEHPELESAVREGRLSQAAAQEMLKAPEVSWPALIQHAPTLTTDAVRQLAKELASKDLDPQAIGHLVASRVREISRTDYDRRHRQHGRVEQVPASPAFRLLRIVRDWQEELPADWVPTDGDTDLLQEVVNVVTSVQSSVVTTGSKAG